MSPPDIEIEQDRFEQLDEGRQFSVVWYYILQHGKEVGDLEQMNAYVIMLSEWCLSEVLHRRTYGQLRVLIMPAYSIV